MLIGQEAGESNDVDLVGAAVLVANLVGERYASVGFARVGFGHVLVGCARGAVGADLMFSPTDARIALSVWWPPVIISPKAA